MPDRLKFFLLLLFAASGFLFGISAIFNYFLFSEFPSIVMLGFGIVIIIFAPIAIYMNYNYSFIRSEEERKNVIKVNSWKLFLIVNVGVLFSVFLIIKGVDFDNRKENYIRSNAPIEILQLHLNSTPKVVKSKGKIIGYKITSKNYPMLTFKINMNLYNKYKYILKSNAKVHISILRKSYYHKILEQNKQLPEIFTWLSDRKIIQIIDIN